MIAANAGLPRRLSTAEPGVTFPGPRPTDLPAEIVLARLAALTGRITGTGPWSANCPVHGDRRRSLRIIEAATGIVSIACSSDCDEAAILAQLDLVTSDLRPSLFARLYSPRRPGQGLRAPARHDNALLQEPTDAECDELAHCLNEWRAPMKYVTQLAGLLEVPSESLMALGVGYHPQEDLWVFPARDHRGRIIGLVRCRPTASGREGLECLCGLMIPDYDAGPPPGPVYLDAGVRGTAAMHSIGVYAIGRPDLAAGDGARRRLARWLRSHVDRDIIVVGDQDVRCGGRAWDASYLARYLQNSLWRPVTWALPARGFDSVCAQIADEHWHRGLQIQEEFLESRTV